MNGRVEKFAHFNTWVTGSVMWAAASDESLKFGVQGASATDFRELMEREITGFNCTVRSLAFDPEQYMWSTAKWLEWCIHLWELQYRMWHLESQMSTNIVMPHPDDAWFYHDDCLLWHYFGCFSRKWAMLIGWSPRFWQIFFEWLIRLRHDSFETPWVFPHKLLGCGRVTVDPKWQEDWKLRYRFSKGCGGMVCEVNHRQWMCDWWDNVLASLPKPEQANVCSTQLDESPRSLSGRSIHLTLVTKWSWSWSWMTYCHPLCAMSFGPPILRYSYSRNPL